MKSITVHKNFNFVGRVDPFSYGDLNNSDYMNDNRDLNDLSVNHQIDGSSATKTLDETVVDTTQVNNQTSKAHVASSSRTMPNLSDLTKESSQFSTFPSLGQSIVTSRSRRESCMPVKFSDYVVEGNHRYDIERTLDYSILSSENKCFLSNLKKTV